MTTTQVVTLATVLAAVAPMAAIANRQVKVETGVVEGTEVPGTRVRAFTGIPFAAPPVGELRWQAPRPPAPWQGVRKASTFGARCMQGRIYEDMIFRDELSEDCLYLNVWTPSVAASDRLPVMVWIYGGGFQSGSTSEPRQDGSHLAGKGVVVVSFNYRLGVFGFFAHPELTKESGRNASGNYALMDMIAALQWVQKNIAAFGGDPGNVTIFGESAGSFAVSALTASPLARDLFHKAIGESGAFFTAGDQPLALQPLEASERAGSEFASQLAGAAGADSLAKMRERPASEILDAVLKSQVFGFRPTLDGYVLPQDVYDVYKQGRQVAMPLLAGWNRDEARPGVMLSPQKPTAASFTERVRGQFGPDAETMLKLYPAGSDAEALESAADLASDLFTGYCTWKWIEMHAAGSRAPVYRYSFNRKIPVPPGTVINGRSITSADMGARHAGEIEYVFGTLDSVPQVEWQPEDRKLSDQMMTYWTNFARSGDPNGEGVPAWPRYEIDRGRQVLHLDTMIRAAPDPRQPRYELLDAYTTRMRATKP